MKTAFAILAGVIGAVIGALWLIGFIFQGQLGLLTHYSQHGDFVYMAGVGFLLVIFAAIVAFVCGVVGFIVWMACFIIDDEWISPWRYQRRRRLQASSR